MEILRIISMMFIIAHHLVVHGMAKADLVLTNPNSYVIYFLSMFGKIGVVIFILISAYFMIESKFTLRKLLVLGGEVYFYSFLFLAIAIAILTPSNISISNIGQSLLPLSHNGYWFITCYIVLMLFSPFLNKFIKAVSKNTLIKAILLSVLLWCIFPTFIPSMVSYPFQNVFVGNNFQYTPLVWFFVIYLIGSYIRLYLNLDKLNNKKLVGGFIISVILIYIGTCIFAVLDGFSTAHLFWGAPAFDVLNGSLFRAFSLENNFFVLAASVFLFLIFLKRKSFSNQYINYLAGSAFGVYLIHDNIFLRKLLWNKLQLYSYYNSPNLLLIAIVVIILIYVGCGGIDIIRRLTIEKLWIWIVDNKLIFLSDWIGRVTNYLIEKFP